MNSKPVNGQFEEFDRSKPALDSFASFGGPNAPQAFAEQEQQYVDFETTTEDNNETNDGEEGEDGGKFGDGDSK